MEPRRKQYLSETRAPLLLQASARLQAERYQQFLTDSGLGAGDVVTTPLVAVPLPHKRRGAGPRGWPVDLNPAVMWHPLFWLPPRLALRYRFLADDPAGIENDNEWAVRVAIESTISTLFDPNDGTWVDVLSLVDLDVDSPEVQNRLREWLSGQPDADLDAIDLSGMTELVENPDWAVEESAELIATLLPASWALIASDLIDELSIQHEDLLTGVQTVASLARGVLSDVPANGADSYTPDEMFMRVLSTAGDSVPANVAAEQLLGELRRIQADYYPFLDLLSMTTDESEEQGRLVG